MNLNKHNNTPTVQDNRLYTAVTTGEANTLSQELLDSCKAAETAF